MRPRPRPSRPARAATGPFLVALLASVLAAPLAAQEVAPAAAPLPQRPDSVLTPGARHAGFLAWRTRVAERARAGASFLVQGARYQLLVLSPMAVDALAPDSLALKATRGCQKALRIGDLEVERIAAHDPWAAFDSAARARPVVALVVLPLEERPYDCHAGNLARFAALSRGTLHGPVGAYVRTRDAARAELRRDGLLEPAVLAGRAPVTKVGLDRAVQDGTQHLRLYLEPELFAPTAEGAAARLEVHVWNPVDPEPEILPVPEQVVRAVWQQLLPWRATLLGDDGEVPRLPTPLVLPAPRDSALLAAHRAYEVGARGDASALGDAAAGALERLMYRSLPPRREIRGAMLEAASVFSAFGEDEAAMSLVADVMEAYPCLTFAPSVQPSLREMGELARTPARCTSVPLPWIALRSIVPGGGTWTTPQRRGLALTFLATTVGAYLLAEATHDFADGEYAKYAAYDGRTEPRAGPLYKRAQFARTMGNVTTVAAASIWAFSAGEALWHEWEHARALRDVRDVGAPRGGRRTASVLPLVAPGRAGLALSIR